MPQQKDIIIHNDDKTSFDYVLLMLDKVFGIDKDEGKKIAQQVDRLGSAKVFTGTESEAQEKLDLIQIYNDATSNNLKFTQEDAGVYQTPQAPSVVTQGASLTLQLANYAPSLSAIYQGVGNIVRAGNLKISQKQGQDIAQDLVEGREVLLKDFENDPQGKLKAEFLKDLIVSSLGFDGSDPDIEQEKIDNVVFSVRPASYTLQGPKQLVSEQDQADSIFLDGIGGIGDMVDEAYNKQLVEKYGSVEEFLKNGSQEEIDEYNSIQESLAELESLLGEKKAKLKR